MKVNAHVCVWVLLFCSRSRKKMQNVSNLSILTMLIMYMLSALFGYLTFYGKMRRRHAEAKARQFIQEKDVM